MTIRHLKLFLSVCETGTTVAAAQAVPIAQSSVSAAIAEMERFYGVRLFDRIGRRLCLTDAGRQLNQYATHIVSLFDQMELRVADFETAGVLRVQSSITIGSELLPAFLGALKKRYPALRAQVNVTNSERVERAIALNEADVGFVEGAVRSADLESRRFGGDRLTFLCEANHPFAGRAEVAPGELAGEDMLFREKGSAGRDLVESMLSLEGLSVTPLWQSISTQTIVNAVRAGLGVAVLPELMVKGALERGEIARFGVSGVALKRDFYVVWHRNKYLTRGMRALIDATGAKM